MAVVDFKEDLLTPSLAINDGSIDFQLNIYIFFPQRNLAPEWLQ
jgi:hypothetical protein